MLSCSLNAVGEFPGVDIFRISKIDIFMAFFLGLHVGLKAVDYPGSCAFGKTGR